MDKSSTYCVMPHLGMSVQNHSDFTCCNLNKQSWQNNKRETIHIHSHDVTSVFDNHTRKIISAKLDHGHQHPSCQVCWDAESVGNTSARQTLNAMFGHIDPLPDQPRVLIIKPGNTCNFACRMCNPMTSSSWYADGYHLERANLTSNSWYPEIHVSQPSALTFHEYTRTFENIRNSFNSDNKEFWNTLKSWMANLVFIDIYGGEPFLTPAMFELLEHGVEIHAAKNISLQLHTNASVFNPHYMEILSHYQSVKISVSIDSMDPAQLEYIRYKSDYETVINNTKKFQNFIKDRANMFMSISHTVTPLNVFYTDQTNQALELMFGLPVGVNMVVTPEYDTRHLPIPVKQQLISQLKNFTAINFLKQTIPGCDIQWPKFCQATDMLDQLRKQSFAHTFPEWWTVLEPHWVKS